jgi:hypothetical protein
MSISTSLNAPPNGTDNTLKINHLQSGVHAPLQYGEGLGVRKWYVFFTAKNAKKTAMRAKK